MPLPRYCPIASRTCECVKITDILNICFHQKPLFGNLVPRINKGDILYHLYSFIHSKYRPQQFVLTSGPTVRFCSGRSLPPGKDPVPIVQEAGWAPGPVWTGAENLTPPGFDPRTVQPVARHYTDWANRPTYNLVFQQRLLCQALYPLRVQKLLKL